MSCRTRASNVNVQIGWCQAIESGDVCSKLEISCLSWSHEMQMLKMHPLWPSSPRNTDFLPLIGTHAWTFDSSLHIPNSAVRLDGQAEFRSVCRPQTSLELLLSPPSPVPPSGLHEATSFTTELRRI